MLNGFLLLLGLQLAGEVVAAGLGLPLPGMVLGLLMLLGLLAWRARRLGPERAIPPELDALAKGLHGNLGLLFVPAGAGVLVQADLIAREGVAILLAILVSTAVTIAVTARLAQGRVAARPAPQRTPERADAAAPDAAVGGSAQ